MDDKFIKIFHLYKNDIFRLSYSYTKNISDSEDILQNVFMKLYNDNDILSKNEYEIKKWLVRVTINDCKSLLLSFWKRKIKTISLEEENNFPIEILHDNIILAVLNLPKKYRIVIYLYYYEDYKIREISDILKISETCIQTRLSRARKMLKEALREDWEYE